jgi:tRNA pseudouridine55 synthase
LSRRRKGDALSGWVCFDKPYNMTSTTAVAIVRRRFNAQKAGHAGTLDPLATGILPIALGEATKTVPYLMDATKVYRVVIAWGESTTTLDREGDVTERSDHRPSIEQIEARLPDFLGTTLQVPPDFSAIRVEGERAYDLARQGAEFELKARPVRIDRLEVIGSPGPDQVELEMQCGKGTYVRSVVRDLARALGTCGHVAGLRRTRVGQFDEGRAIGLEKLENLGHTPALLEALLPVETALDDIPELAVTAEDAFRLKQGRAIVLVPRQAETLMSRVDPVTGLVSASLGGTVVALCKMVMGQLNPVRVFHMNPSGD